MCLLNHLVNKREDILKSQLFMFLHDIGKLQPGHQAKFIRGRSPRKPATRFNQFNHDTDIPNHQSLSSILSLCANLPPNNTSVDLYSFIRRHHQAMEAKDGLWPVFARRIDRLDSRWDRGSIISTGVQPLEEFISIDSPFGWTRMAYRRVNSPSDIQCGGQIPWSLYYTDSTKFNQQDCLDRLFRCLVSFVQGEPGSGSPPPKIEVFRHTRRSILQVITEKACGDTRYTVNDITLWDHSISTAILLKILAAWIVLSNPSLNNRQFPRSNDERFARWFRPQLLPLRIDGLGYLAASNNIPDLLARRALLQKVYDTWQDILEWEFPLAGEVYRDENGPVFLTFLRDGNGQGKISLENLTLPESTDGSEHVLPKVYQRLVQNQRATLKEYLRQAIVESTQGDLTLPSDIPLYTYIQERTGRPDEKSLGDLLAEEQKQGLWLQENVETIKQAWHGGTGELCSVCGLRPMGFGATNEDNKQKAISRGMCGVCLERRVERAKTWAEGIHKSPQERLQESHPETVWLDEVADKNGRLALIVGYFPLEHWLDGTLVESLGMFKQNRAENPPTNRRVSVTDESGNTVEVILGPKPVSYSRIRRIWETTRRFWQEVAPTDPPPEELRNLCASQGLDLKDLWPGPLSLEDSLAGKVIGKAGLRLQLQGTLQPLQPGNSPGPYHTYELVLPRGIRMSVLWDEARQRFITCDNLTYLEGPTQLGRSLKEVLKAGTTLTLEEPVGYGAPNKVWGQITLSGDATEIPDSTYIPLIPILAEPRTFMALVPADKAIAVVQAIKAKYEREMGKVRNRLPLHLGIVFAHRRIPLRAILDAGRRMLKQKARADRWTVRAIQQQPDAGGLLPSRFGPDAQGQFARWLEIELEKDDRRLTWYVPAVMGDGQTEDHWYPYVYWQQDASGNTEPDKASKSRTCYYQGPNPFNPNSSGKPQPGWLVHAGELQPGDFIYFTPATLDFIWLDPGGRRFEITYDVNGQRLGTLRRPYLLDELDDLVECWELLAGKEDGQRKIRRLSIRQLHIVRDLIEGKRAEWFENPLDSVNNETFRRFCESVLQNAEWQTEPTETEFERLTRWAITGLLADAVELFHHILKQRPVGEEE